MNWIKGIASTVGGFLLGLLGNIFVPICILLACNIIDYLTGVTASLATGGLQAYSSKRGFKGIAKKICMLLLVVIGIMLDLLITYYGAKVGWNFSTSGAVCITVTLWLIFNEMTSILENLSTVGVPIPSFLKKLVKALRKKADNAGNALLTDAEEQKEEKKEDGIHEQSACESK